MEERIKDIVEKYFELADRKDCFVVELIGKSSKKLEVYIDSDDAIDFEICKKVSRIIEAYLDETLDMGEDYILEVSSPGLSRPLKLPRQFQKNIGREVTVTTAEKAKYTGKLQTADEAQFTITYQEKVMEGKKKVLKDIEKSFGYSEGAKVIINIKF